MTRWNEHADAKAREQMLNDLFSLVRGGALKVSARYAPLSDVSRYFSCRCLSSVTISRNSMLL
jgi:hypothetical protein